MSEVTTAPPNTKLAVALTGLSTAIENPKSAIQNRTDLWIVYLPKGDRAVDQSAEDGTAACAGPAAPNADRTPGF